jgi:hypothetical protein
MLENLGVDSEHSATECSSSAWYLEAIHVKLLLIPVFFFTAERRVQLIYVFMLYVHPCFVVNTPRLPYVRPRSLIKLTEYVNFQG